jgi:ATP-dependent helicase/DNAse subunit B
MPLSLIVGPPNSGRAGELRGRFMESLESDPVLVVPTRDDADRFERELSQTAGAVVGGSVVTFPWLFEDVARATDAELLPRLTASQRLWLVRAAARDADLRILRASAASAGFAFAVERLIGELQAGGVDPATLEARAAATDADGAYEVELAAIYRRYEGLRDELERADRHSLAAAAMAALRAEPEAWGRRPVLLYGFDDLTAEQLELVDALAAVCDVTVAVAYEDRAALAARARMLEDLREHAGGRVVAEPPADRSYTASETLFHLERNLFETAPRIDDSDGGVVFMSAAGERAEAEQIGGEIARLLRSDTDPDEIAVVLRSPERYGLLYEEILSGLGIPVAVDAHVAFSATATGRALVALLRAVLADGTADDALTFLRAPGRAHPDQVDWLERDVRRRGLRSPSEVFERWRERVSWEPSEIERLREAAPGGLPGVVAELARKLAERPHHRTAPRPGRAVSLELRAAAEAGRALAEISEIGGADGADEVIAALEDLRVPLWRGPAEGRVRVLSPYRARARRVGHLFVASLQEGDFPTRDPGDPLLGEDRRRALGLPPRRDPEHEERYLFYSCVSRPTERLYLSWRDSDDDGQTLAPSPFLDDVRDLLRVDGGPTSAATRRRGLDRVTFDPAEAPSADELARSLAALGPRAEHATVLRDLGVPSEVADPVLERLEEAARKVNGLPGPLTAGPVLELLAARPHYGASTLEEFALCSYRWFVRHELEPQDIEPDPEPLTQGAIVHEVLERLYGEPPGRDRLPRPGDLDAWMARARELVAEAADRRGLARDALGRVGRRRMEALIERFLIREAESETPLRPDPALLEASFGENEDDDRPPLAMKGFGLHGKIDRVDTDPSGRLGLVRDYKLGRSVTAAAKLEKEGKLQPQLYMLALREAWGIEPIGGVYAPLGATDDPRARGLLRREERGLVDDGGFVNTDFLDDERFDAALADARERAAEIVARMRGGDITRDPIDDRCPTFCRFQPICRRERAVAAEPVQAEESEEEDQA